MQASAMVSEDLQQMNLLPKVILLEKTWQFNGEKNE